LKIKSVDLNGIFQKISKILELNDKEWESITSLYESIFLGDQVSTLNNCNSLSGAPLSYMFLAIELDHFFR